MIGGRGAREGSEEGVRRPCRKKGVEVKVKMDDGRKERKLWKRESPEQDGGVIERHIQIKPYTLRLWMIKPGA